MRTPLANVQTSRELNIASARIYRPLFYAVLGMVVLFVAYVYYDDFTLARRRIAIFLLWPGLFLLLYGFTRGGLVFSNWVRVKGCKPSPPPSPRVSMEQETAPQNSRLESTQGNQMLLSRYKFSRRQWWKLIGALRNWGRVWSRDHSLHESGIFTMAETGLILNASGVYSDLTKDFSRMKVIQKRGGSWYVTSLGWTELHKSAGSNGVIT